MKRLSLAGPSLRSRRSSSNQPSERHGSLRRNVRGRPNCGKTLLSPNQVIADIRSLSGVRTSMAHGLAMSVLGGGEVDAKCRLGVGAGRHEQRGAAPESAVALATCCVRWRRVRSSDNQSASGSVAKTGGSGGNCRLTLACTSAYLARPALQCRTPRLRRAEGNLSRQAASMAAYQIVCVERGAPASAHHPCRNRECSDVSSQAATLTTSDLVPTAPPT